MRQSRPGDESTDSISRWLVGSSSNNRLAGLTISLPKSTRLFSPPESTLTFLEGAVAFEHHNADADFARGASCGDQAAHRVSLPPPFFQERAAGYLSGRNRPASTVNEGEPPAPESSAAALLQEGSEVLFCLFRFSR